MKAWLITLQGTSQPEKVISILPPRYPANKVREYVEQLYVDLFLSPTERISYLKNKKNAAYQAEFDTINGVQVCRITCGHNPWLFARPVVNLQVITDEQGTERFNWQNRPLPVMP